MSILDASRSTRLGFRVMRPLLPVLLLVLLALYLLFPRSRTLRQQLLALAPLHESYTFPNIYVLSLPHRTDRRKEMELLAEATGLKFTFVEAVSREESYVGWIGERVVELREQKKRLMRKTMKGMGAEDRRPIGLTTHQDAGNSIPFPPTPWLDILHSHAANQTLHLLAPSPTPPGLARDPILPPQAQHLAEIATYLSHLNALKLIEESDQEGLILEDDVDFEFFFKDMWSGIHRFIPNGWETVFLGSCGERENEEAPYLHPYLRRSTAPYCTHAYTITPLAASLLLHLLSQPWTAFQAPIDLAYVHLVRAHHINSFSIDPPLVVQRESGKSDVREEEEGVRKGQGKWSGVLVDSAWDRILRSRGEEVEARIPYEEWDIYRTE